MHPPRGVHRKRLRPAVVALRAAVAGAAVVTVVGVHAACSAPPAQPGAAYPGPGQTASKDPPSLPAARTREPAATVSVLSAGTPGDLSARFVQALFSAAPVVVVASAGGAAARPSPASKGSSASGKTAPAADVLGLAASAAAAAHAPLLLAPGVTSTLVAEIKALHPQAVFDVNLPAAPLTRQLGGIRVATRAAQLPATAPPPPLSGLAVLVRGPGTSAAVSPGVTAVTATARAAGATVIDTTGPDPRADPRVISELARLRPGHVVAVGAAFGPAARLRARLAVAETGRQLPGGGQVLFPGRRLVALYGHPGAPGLGVLGHQDLSASIARAESTAAAYRPLSDIPVIPAFEIIASVAEASPGPDGSYSAVTPVAELLPWVREATAAGLYVVLDLQPGRASLLAQAQDYQSLLKLPDVGLALDPEWKLTANETPLHQIGHVDIAEVNSVIRWLAALTARYHLPQKLLVLHQFRLDMLPGEAALDTSHDDLAIVVHMDGQGTPGEKQATWDAVTAAAPRGVYFGFKDFFVMDHPMLSPQQTMAHTPAPMMISYQ